MNELCQRRAAPSRSPGMGRRLSMGCVMALLGLLGSACGSSHDRPPPAPAEADFEVPDLTNYDSSTADARDVFAAGECEDGATQSCRVYLPSHDGIQPCFVGMQACVDAQWGLCDDAVLVDANANDTQLDPAP